MSCACVIVQDLSHCTVPKCGGDEALYRRLKLMAQERETTQTGACPELWVDLALQVGVDSDEGLSD